MNVKDALTEYLSRGYAVVPIPPRAKGPKIPKWHLIRFTAESFKPNDNVGLILGEASSNLVDVDLDSDAAIFLADVFLPSTGMVHGRSGKPRSHRWYILEDAPATITQFTDPGGAMLVEIRSGSEQKGAQTVVPPSVHTTGEAIEWAEFGKPARLTLAELEPAVKRLAAASMLVRVFPAKGRHKFCLALAGVLLRGGFSEEQARVFVRAVADAGGSSDPDARAAVVSSTAQKILAGENTTGIPTLIECASGDVLGPLVSVYVTKALDLVIERAEAASSYSMEDIERFASTCGIQAKDYLASMIVQDARSSTMWVRDETSFKPPVQKQHIELAVEKWLADYPLERMTTNKKGEDVPLTTQAIAKACTVLAEKVTASFTVPRSVWQDGEFTERLAPLRDLEATFDAQVDEWLRLLGGKDAEKLLDWLSVVTRLDEQCCALYLCGSAGAGKGLLAQGVSRLWTVTGPVPLKAIMGSFNDPLATCPLVFADEAIPDRSASASLRSLIADSSLSLNRKHLSCLPIQGSIRLLVAANNDAVLSFDEILTGEDIEALGVRFLKIDVGEAPRSFLQKLGSWDATGAWVTQDRIAKHVLWLSQTRVPTRGRRFIIDGNAGEIGKIIRKHGKTEGYIMGVIMDALEQDGGTLDPPVLVDKNGIWLHSRRIYAALRDGNPNMKLTEREVMTTATNLCLESRQNKYFSRLVGGRERLRVRALNLEILKEWAEQVRGYEGAEVDKLINARLQAPSIEN